MKFELMPNNRNASAEDILRDLKHVAEELSKTTLTGSDYKRHGRFNYSTVTRRFGSWNNAIELADLEILNHPKVEDSELLEDLKSIAIGLNQRAFTQLEYLNGGGKYSVDAYKDHFKSWNIALEMAGLERSRNMFIAEEHLFENLEEVWMQLGRQPFYGEMTKPLSKYSRDVYVRRFGSWRKALEVFVESISKSEVESTYEKIPIKTESSSKSQEKTYKRKTKRDPNWRLRFLVMKRDNFKCQSCGRSPATDPNVILHIDHKNAWANGGETEISNLQTLCSICNIGKSNI